MVGIRPFDVIERINNEKVKNFNDWNQVFNRLVKSQYGICVSKQFINQFLNSSTKNINNRCNIGHCCPADDQKSLCFLYQTNSFSNLNLNQCNSTDELIKSNLNDYFKWKLSQNGNNLNEIIQNHNQICLPVRKTIENGIKYCHFNEMEPKNCSPDEHCLYPYLDQTLLRLIIIDIQFNNKSIIYIGVPGQLYQSIKVTDQRPYFNLISIQFFINFETFFR